MKINPENRRFTGKIQPLLQCQESTGDLLIRMHERSRTMLNFRWQFAHESLTYAVVWERIDALANKSYAQESVAISDSGATVCPRINWSMSHPWW